MFILLSNFSCVCFTLVFTFLWLMYKIPPATSNSKHTSNKTSRFNQNKTNNNKQTEHTNTKHNKHTKTTNANKNNKHKNKQN